MSKISSPLAVGGIIFIIIGMIMVIAGIVALISNRQNPSVWYVWLLIIGGMFFGVSGGIMLAIALSRSEDYSDPRPAYYETVQEPYSSPSMGNTAPGLLNTAQLTNAGQLSNSVAVPYYAQTAPQIHRTQSLTEGNTVISNSIQTASWGAPGTST